MTFINSKLPNINIIIIYLSAKENKKQIFLTTERQSESTWSAIQSRQGDGGGEGGAGGGAGGGHPVHHEPRITSCTRLNLTRLNNLTNFRGRDLYILVLIHASNISDGSLPPFAACRRDGVGGVAVGTGGHCSHRSRGGYQEHFSRTRAEEQTIREEFSFRNTQLFKGFV